MNNKIISTLVLLVSLFTSFTMQVSAAVKSPSIVAIGDSITSGYGLPGYDSNSQSNTKDSFIDFLCKQTGTEIKNFSKSGITSSQLLGWLSKVKSDKNISKVFQNSDVVSITIGGNNLLIPLYMGLMQQFQTTDIDATKNKFLSILNDPNNNADDIQKINAVLDGVKNDNSLMTQFESDLTSIFESLRKFNPKVQIIVQTLYNPFLSLTANETNQATVESFTNQTKSIIDKFNDAITEVSTQHSHFVYVADVGAKMQSKHILGLSTDFEGNITFDPHPSVLGHQLIGEIVYGIYQSLSIPKTSHNSNMMIISGLFIVSLIGIISTYYIKKKQKKVIV